MVPNSHEALVRRQRGSNADVAQSSTDAVCALMDGATVLIPVLPRCWGYINDF